MCDLIVKGVTEIPYSHLQFYIENGIVNETEAYSNDPKVLPRPKC